MNKHYFLNKKLGSFNSELYLCRIIEKIKEKFYINAENTFTKISKYDFELKSAIVRAMRKVSPHVFPGFTLEWKS